MEVVRLYKTSELCDLFGVTRQSIYKWRQAGMPVAIDNSKNGLIRGKTIRYDIDDVISWLNRTDRDDLIHTNNSTHSDNSIHEHPMGAGFAHKDYK